MTDAILFRPKFLDYTIETLPIPWGLLYVGSSLVNSGYSVKVIDELTHPNWQDLILEELKHRPLFVGVTSMTGRQIKYGLKFSSFIKKHSCIPIVWGGIHPSIFPKQTLRNENIDFVVKREGEKTIIEFMEFLEGKQEIERIKGLGFKKNGSIHVNEDRPFIRLENLHRLHYSLIDVHDYIGNRFGAQRSFELCTSRGCPHPCSFCYSMSYYKRTWRSMSVDHIFDNLHKVIESYQIDGLTWREDNFFVSKKRVREIAERIIREKINISWHADCRIDYLDNYDDSFIGLLKQSGCHTLTMGVESGSDIILKKINKGINREQVLRVKEKLSKHGIFQNYHFMLGLPDESKEDVKKTISLMSRLMEKNKYFSHIYGPSLYTPYPATTLYEKCLQKGFNPPKKLEGWIDMDWHSLRLPWVTGMRRKVIEDIAWNIMGMKKKTVYPYFKVKFLLLAKLNIHIPCFEKKIYPLFRYIQDFMTGIFSHK
ncbi:MAG: radical SAM protein [Candidatus Aminicenantes bacterium]